MLFWPKSSHFRCRKSTTHIICVLLSLFQNTEYAHTCLSAPAGADLYVQRHWDLQDGCQKIPVCAYVGARAPLVSIYTERRRSVLSPKPQSVGRKSTVAELCLFLVWCMTVSGLSSQTFLQQQYGCLFFWSKSGMKDISLVGLKYSAPQIFPLSLRHNLVYVVAKTIQQDPDVLLRCGQL